MIDRTISPQALRRYPKHNRKSFLRAPVFGLSLFFSLPLIPGIAQDQHVLWQIGQKDHDDKEFALAPKDWSHYRDDSYYIVGKSKPEADWNFVQPGPDDNWAGNQIHASNIDFILDQAVADGTCSLTLTFVDTHQASPPKLEIRVNGQLWIRDTTPGGGNDSINGQPDHGKPSTVTVDFPASLLTKGLNSIEIANTHGSWVIYDAVTLTGPDGDTLGVPSDILRVGSAGWMNTVLKKDAGVLKQVLQLHTFNSGAARSAELRVSGEKAVTVNVPSGRGTVEAYFPETHTASKTTVQLFDHEQPVGPVINAQRTPVRRYTIYCIAHSHMDVGYNYLPQRALAEHQKDIVEALDLFPQSASLPFDNRFRWNCESLYEVDDWLKSATPAQVDAFRAAANNGDLGLSALYCNELTGLCRPEELAALMDCANHLRNKYGIKIDSAMISDVPAYTGGLVSMLAQAGVKYFSWGPNGGDHTGFSHKFDNKAFYWVSPSGKDRVMVWQGLNGYYPAFSDNAGSMTQFLSNFQKDHPDYPYDMLYERVTVGDNGLIDKDLAPFVHDWNSKYAYPHLVVGTNSRMFHDFEAKYGRTLPEMHGDFTGFWEDGAASTAVETAINRNSGEAIAQGEILYSMLNPAAYPYTRFDDAWKNTVLYDEHTWGADRSWSEPESEFVTKQWAFKRQFALNAQKHAEALQADAFQKISATDATGAIAVFNTNSWKRTDLVILPASMSRAGDVVRNEKGRDVPSQRLKDGTLAFIAADIPPTSSRKFRVFAGASQYRGSASAMENALKTSALSLQIDPATGAITNWKSNGIAQDLVDTGNKTCRGLNDYLYILGDNNADVQHVSGAKVTVVDNGPLIASVRVDSDAPGSKTLSRTIQVIDGLNQVRFEDSFDKLAVHQNEAVHLGFNFNVPGAQVRMDMPWSVVRPDVDQMIYANKNIYPVDRWVDVSNGQFGITMANLDSPMMQIGEITAQREWGETWLTEAKKGSAIYWNVMNNYWHTNYKAYQPGPATFRYAMVSHGAYDQSTAQKFGIGQSQPLLVTPVKSDQPDAVLPLAVDNDAVMITSCKPAGDGNGWLVRLFNGSDRKQAVTLAWNGSTDFQSEKTDLWGNNGKPFKNTSVLQPMEIVTLRMSH